MKLKYILWIVGVLLGAGLLLGAGWFLGQHSQEDYNPYQALKGYESSRHGFIVKSSELSVDMVNRAIEALKKKEIPQAIKDCKTAIDLFPIDTKPYILLTKLYLVTGQEERMFDVLTLAGRSYPNFNNILEAIDDENLAKIPLNEQTGDIYLADFPEDKKTAISFMFDDGESNIYKALPIFEKYDYRATIPVVAGFVSKSSSDHFWGSWAQWKDAATRGFEIANHSMFHRDERTLHGEEFDEAIDQAQDTIEKHIGREVKAYVFPHDNYSEESVSRALRHHESIRTPEFLRSFYARTVDIVLGGPYVSLSSAERLVDIAIKRHWWYIAKCHGVTDQRSMRSFKSITPDFLGKYLAYIHAKSNDVWVDTFSHVFEYMAQRSKTTIEIKVTGINSMDFMLHSNTSQEKPAMLLTVVIKAEGASSVSAEDGNGRKFKAWPCSQGVCVDVDVYEQTIHVQWK